jgi:hypothetical protein
MKKLIARWKSPINSFWKWILNVSLSLSVGSIAGLAVIKANEWVMPDVFTALSYIAVITATIAGCAKTTKK